jgi:ATP-dependent Clp protease adaptor protein ClpS
MTHSTYSDRRERAGFTAHASAADAGNISLNIMGAHPREKEGDLLVIEPNTKVARPPMFKVMMLNDDYTPMEFVVEVLKTIFHQPHEEAMSIMLAIHHQGSGLCGVYTRDVAETKIDHVVHIAREHEYPLQCRLEQE